MNELVQLMTTFHTMPWDAELISANPNISMKVIKYNYNWPWEFKYVSKNQNLDFEMVAQRPNLDWDWRALSVHPNLTCTFIAQNPELPWVWPSLSFNPAITWRFVMQHPEWPWCWYGLTMNHNITHANIMRSQHLPWHPIKLAAVEPKLTTEYIMANADREWCGNTLGSDPDLDLEYLITELPHILWCWHDISGNTSLTLDVLLRHPHWP
jgi:hypothetical protein